MPSSIVDCEFHHLLPWAMLIGVDESRNETYLQDIKLESNQAEMLWILKKMCYKMLLSNCMLVSAMYYLMHNGIKI